MKYPTLFLSPDPAAPSTPDAPANTGDKRPRTRGAFDRTVAAELSEALELVLAAREAPFAKILANPYEVTPDFITDLETKTREAQRKFGLAVSGDAAGRVSTVQKQKLEDALDAAIRRIQTGARLSFPTSLDDQRRWGIGIDLGNAEDQVELLVPQMLAQLETEKLRSVKPDHIERLRATFEAWMQAGGAQSDTKLGARTDRAGGTALLRQIEPMIRDIKVSIDGEFPYDAPNPPDRDIKAIRKKFHLPENRPYVYIPAK